MTPAISTTRPLPWVTGRLTNNGTITAAAITGRSSRMGPVFPRGAQVGGQHRGEDHAVDDHRFGELGNIMCSW
jgi:hypothetical protein